MNIIKDIGSIKTIAGAKQRSITPAITLPHIKTFNAIVRDTAKAIINTFQDKRNGSNSKLVNIRTPCKIKCNHRPKPNQNQKVE